MVAVLTLVTLLRVFSENVEVGKTSYQLLEVQFIILRSGEGVTSSSKGNSANFSSEKW